MQIASLQFI